MFIVTTKTRIIPSFLGSQSILKIAIAYLHILPVMHHKEHNL